MVAEKSRSVARKPPSTRDRIVDVSRRLFNLEGLQATALYRVAADVGISAGNLNYHFKTKADLAGALADRFDAEFRTLTGDVTVPPDAASFIANMQQVLSLLWRYRFFLNTPQYLNGVDPALAAKSGTLLRSLRNLIRQYTHGIIEAGGLRMPHDKSADILADNIVAVWIYWLQIESQPAPSDPDLVDEGAMRECLDHHFGLLEPYLSRTFADHFRGALDEMMPAGSK